MGIASIPANRRDRHHDMIGAIHRELSTSGELRLLAATIARAIEDAKSGDLEAAAWLASPAALRMIERFTPPSLEPQQVQTALLEAAGSPIEPRRATPGHLEQVAARLGL